MPGRLGLAFERNPSGARGPEGRLLLGELAALPAMFAGGEPMPPVERARDAQPVILVPGFLTGPGLMRPLRRALEAAGHRVDHWGQGLNLGLTPENLAGLVARASSMHAESGKPVTLIGWSLGGLFAREAAKRAPLVVGRVITMGSPFSGDRRANNAWRLYHLVAGHSVDHPPGVDDLAAKPPARTIAIWSGADGIVSPAAAAGSDSERDAAVEVGCRHMLLPSDHATIAAILNEIDT